MTLSETITTSDTKQRNLELAVPLLAFGATLAGVLLWRMGIEIDFQFFAVGCVFSSCLLAYLAWIRPKKDIVALSTPIYAFIFFVVPTDYVSGLMLQLLYGVSITLLLVRLKYRFGQTHTAVSLGKELAVPLKTYIEKTHDAVSECTPDAAHELAVMISRFSVGEYCDVALMEGTFDLSTELTPVVTRAFNIVCAYAYILDQSLPRPDPYQMFLPEDENLLAKVILPEYSKDRMFDTTFDNAMLLLFSAAWNASEADRPHLLSCQGFVMKLLAD